MRLILLLEHATLADAGWAAAIMVDGKVYAADDHHSAYLAYFSQKGEAIESWEAHERRMTDFAQEGFLSPEGVFLTREESIARWRAEKNLQKQKRDREWGDSSDLYHSPELIGT